MKLMPEVLKERIILAGIILILLGLCLPFLFPNNTVASNLSSILIGAGLVDLVIRFLALEDLIKRIFSGVKKEIDKIPELLHIPLEAFYENRGDLMKSFPSLGGELDSVSEVWFAWYTGSVIEASGFKNTIKNIGKVRLLLTHPESKALNEYEKIGEHKGTELKEDIKSLSRIAQNFGAEVKWFDGLIGNSIVIGNPNLPNAWARVEVMIPFAETNLRPSFRVSKDKGKIAFQEIYNMYESLWRRSQPPEFSERRS